MRNTNGLIGRYPGADGMKTGFICSSGFNVVASATRNGRQLITVVIGAPSANERTIKAAELFDRGFASPSLGIFNPSLDGLAASVLQSPPNMRAVICDRRGPAPEEEDSPPPLSAGNDSESGPSLAGTNVFAFAAGPSTGHTVLGPRAAVQPVRVWTGANPPSEADIAAQAAAEEAAAAARLSKGKKGKKVIAKKGGRVTVSLKPVGGAKQVHAKPAVKAASKAGGKGAPKTN